MIHSRTDLLARNEVLTAHLLQTQEFLYRPREPWRAGQSVILHCDEPAVTLTAEQAAELNAEDEQYYEDNRDKFPHPPSLEWLPGLNLAATGEDGDSYLRNLGASLAALSPVYGQLIVLGDWNTPWLYQDNDYFPVQNALTYLRQYVAEDFSGGFLLDEDTIPTFLSHLFWLVRCNAALPHFMMSFERGQSVFTLCKYGLFHLEFADQQEREALLSFFAQRGFREMEHCSDPVEFDNFRGRRLKL
jgi:hypothetical protein